MTIEPPAYANGSMAGAMSRMILTVMAAMAQLEREIMLERQREGIARRLWDQALKDLCAPNAEGVLTVNSSLAAVPVYQAFGFVPAGPIQSAHGISFLPMHIRHS